MNYVRKFVLGNVINCLRPSLSEGTTFDVNHSGHLLLMCTQWGVRDKADNKNSTRSSKVRKRGVTQDSTEQTPAAGTEPAPFLYTSAGTTIQFEFGSLWPREGILLLQPNPELFAFGVPVVSPTYIINDMVRPVILSLYVTDKIPQGTLEEFSHFVEVIQMR